MSGLGMPLQFIAPQPPYIRFETRPIETRDAGGNPVFTDKDFALVTTHGSKDVVEKILPQWFDELKVAVQQNRYPAAWLSEFKGAYEAWKSDQEPPVNGHDIRQWPVLSPAQIKQLMALRVTTVEILATANEDLIQKIGMGSRVLKQKAVDWLNAKQDIGPIINKISALEVKQDALELENAALKKELAAANGALEALQRMQVAAPAAGPAAFVGSAASFTPSRDEGDDIDAALDKEIA